MTEIALKRYKPTEYPEVKELFRKHFQVSPELFIDKVLTAAFGEIHLDIIAFDKWLQSKYPETRSKALNRVIIEQYGQEALDLLNSLT